MQMRWMVCRSRKAVTGVRTSCSLVDVSNQASVVATLCQGSQLCGSSQCNHHTPTTDTHSHISIVHTLVMLRYISIVEWGRKDQCNAASAKQADTDRCVAAGTCIYLLLQYIATELRTALATTSRMQLSSHLPASTPCRHLQPAARQPPPPM